MGCTQRIVDMYTYPAVFTLQWKDLETNVQLVNMLCAAVVYVYVIDEYTVPLRIVVEIWLCNGTLIVQIHVACGHVASYTA